MSTYKSMPPTSPPPTPPAAKTVAGRHEPPSWWHRWRWWVILCGALVIVVGGCALGWFFVDRLLSWPSCAKAADPTQSGAVSQYCPSGSEPSGFSLAFGSDGAVWFIRDSDGKIARMTPQSEAVTTFAAPTTDSVADYGLVRGSDGNLWYITEDTLGRITMSGQVSEFALPKELGSASSIAAGPHGPLWVTMWLNPGDGTPPTPRLLEITLPSATTQAPHITQMSLPAIAQDDYPGWPNMAAGQDGSLWMLTDPTTFTRITPAGSRTQFPLTIPGPAPASSCGSDNCKHVVALTAGLDDAMWFIDGWNHAGRITPTGATTYFPMPPGWEFTHIPVAMGAGPDGNIWFFPAGSSDSATIGRITPTGQVTAFPLPHTLTGGSSADNIVAGSDGGVWFLWWHQKGDTGENRISRITP